MKDTIKSLKSTPRIVIVVICRLKSVRLPRKALLPINGVASIERCLLNCLEMKGMDDIVLATSYLPADDPLEDYTIGGRIKVLRGDPGNVALRLVQAAELTGADTVMRVTGDCPVISMEVMEILMKSHLNAGCDFTAPLMGCYAPGTAGDIYTVESLRRLLDMDATLEWSEYLPFYYINNPEVFSLNRIELPGEFRYPGWRLTIDEQKDLELFEEIFRRLDINKEPLPFAKLKDLLIKNPELLEINRGVKLKWVDDKDLVKAINEGTKLTHV